jgi:hypothetical protein
MARVFQSHKKAESAPVIGSCILACPISVGNSSKSECPQRVESGPSAFRHWCSLSLVNLLSLTRVLLEMSAASDDQPFLMRLNASIARCLAPPWSTIGAG